MTTWRFQIVAEASASRCVGRHDTCRSNAVPGRDLCRPCWEALPRCVCGHHVDAHDEGSCAVNRHEGATGPECECQGFAEGP